MLRPHDREHAELGQIRLAPEDLDDLLVFVVSEIMLRDEVFGIRYCHSISFVHITLTTFWIRNQSPEILACCECDWPKLLTSILC